ncbi:MAG: hypothetical protein J5769_04615 [Bacteroidales bacterium]|nr:hypothetical protein [Bacteroidales bacterium]
MKKLLLVAVAAAFIFTPSCKLRSGWAANLRGQADTTVYDVPAASPELPLLEADRTLDDAARILAGMDVDADSPVAFWMEKPLWQKHKTQMDGLWATCRETLDKIDTLAANDFADINEKAVDVFYPFSGPDFAYAASFYPKAQHYWLFALEGTGSVPDLEKTTERAFDKYRQALLYHLQNSYFITKNMQTDLHNSSIDGTISILLVFMARMDYHIMSVTYKTLNADGTFTDSEKPSTAVEIHFFNKAENKERALTFTTTNLNNDYINAGTKALIGSFNPETTVGYTKSCSYCMHGNHFTTVRDYMLNNTFAVIQDDTGVRYHYLKDNFDVTLYGGYVKPLNCFSSSCFQSDLNTLYHHNPEVKPLNFRHGYNRPSSLIVARRK